MSSTATTSVYATHKHSQKVPHVKKWYVLVPLDGYDRNEIFPSSILPCQQNLILQKVRINKSYLSTQNLA